MPHSERAVRQALRRIMSRLSGWKSISRAVNGSISTTKLVLGPGIGDPCTLPVLASTTGIIKQSAPQPQRMTK